MNLLPTDSAPLPGACYRFVVNSADQAATLIRERLGEHARVLSVRSVAAIGLASTDVLAEIGSNRADRGTGGKSSTRCRIR